MFRFVVDRIVRGRAYPNLAQHAAEPYTAAWREFGQHYPGTVPVDLIDYCEQHEYPYSVTTTGEYIGSNALCTNSSEHVNNALHWYPVQIEWFDHAVDYVALLPPEILRVLQDTQNNNCNLRVLFIYDEADDPVQIVDRLDLLCEQNGIDRSSYCLITANTAVENTATGLYFASDELRYYMQNSPIPAKPVKFLKSGVPMRLSFLLTSRSHKWWRAAVVAVLKRQGLLHNAVWSYNTELNIGDRVADCPIPLDTLNLTQEIQSFLSSGPYSCDDLTAEQHNDHSQHVAEHYESTACSIILETHFDCDGSGGAFLTEKTFKCLKHGHPFVLFAAAGTLAQLRDMGYRTFDSVIDTGYDSITDNTERYLAVMHTIQQLAQVGPNDLYNACLADTRHNQQLFLATKWSRLNSLYERLHRG